MNFSFPHRLLSSNFQRFQWSDTLSSENGGVRAEIKPANIKNNQKERASGNRITP
jgi:hypothetical protein